MGLEEKDLTEKADRFYDYLSIESGLELDLFDDRFDVVKHLSDECFKIIERTKDYSRAISLADFNSSNNPKVPTIVYNKYGEPIYVGGLDTSIN